MKKLLTLLALGFVAFSVRAAEFPDISIADVKAAIKSHKAVIIDVNGTESYDKGHVPSALNFESIENKLAQVLPKDKNALIIAYCGNPRCGAYQSAAKAASKLGYKNVKHMSAGIMGWKSAGEKTEKGAKAT
jgi:rhodanese-related sulfurtransferase